MLEARAQSHFYGHTAIEQQMLDAWRQQRLPHSLLLVGPQGVGKATFAYRLARFLMANPQKGSILPNSLNIDSSHAVFHRIASGGHGDMMVIEPEEGATEIAVQNIRAAVRFLSHTSLEGGWRIVIIDGSVNRNAANALLKILEEPPEKSLLILIAEPTHRLPATINSRCHRFAFSPLSHNDLEQCLKQLYPDLGDAEAQKLAALSEGCPGHAVRLSEAGGAALYQELLNVLSHLPSSSSDVDLLAFCQRMAAKPSSEMDSFVILGRLISLWICKLIWVCADSPFPLEISYPTEEEIRVIHLIAPLHTLEQWTKVWEATHQTFQQASTFHLDRFQVLLHVFNRIGARERSH